MVLPNPNPQSSPPNPRTQIFVLGAIGGLLIGLITAYLYDRSAGDYQRPVDGTNRIKTTELIGLLIAGVAFVRQITELGRSDQKRTARRR